MGRKRHVARTPWKEAVGLVGAPALVAKAGSPRNIESYKGLGVPADALVPLLIPLVQAAQGKGTLDPPPLQSMITAIRGIWQAQAPKVWEALEHNVGVFHETAELIRAVPTPTPEVPVRLIVGGPEPSKEGLSSTPPAQTRPTLIRAGTPPPPRRSRRKRRP